MKPEIRNELERTANGGLGLPGRYFLSEEVLSLETTHFFRDSWACVGLCSDAPAPGDVAPLELLGQRLLLVRKRDGELAVYHNVCSHRGARLIKVARRCNAIVCPYHAWSYDLDGRLVQTPHVGGINIHDAPDIDRTTLGLKQVRSAQWAGLVFVNLSGKAPAFADHIRTLEERWHRHDFSLLRHAPDLGQRPQVRANWKLVVENFVESYHLPWVHRSMNQFNPMEDHYQILGGGHFIGQGVKAHRPMDNYASRLPCFPSLGERELGNGESMFLPPNLLIIFMSQFFFVNILNPLDAATTGERAELFVVADKGMDPELADSRAQLMEMLVQVNNEDIEICELVQQGRGSDAFTGGVFSSAQEATTLAFQKLLAHRLLEAGGVPAGSLPALPTGEIHHPNSAAEPAVADV